MQGSAGARIAPSPAAGLRPPLRGTLMGSGSEALGAGCGVEKKALALMPDGEVAMGSGAIVGFVDAPCLRLIVGGAGVQSPKARGTPDAVASCTKAAMLNVVRRLRAIKARVMVRRAARRSCAPKGVGFMDVVGGFIIALVNTPSATPFPASPASLNSSAKRIIKTPSGTRSGSAILAGVRSARLICCGDTSGPFSAAISSHALIAVSQPMRAATLISADKPANAATDRSGALWADGTSGRGRGAQALGLIS